MQLFSANVLSFGQSLSFLNGNSSLKLKASAALGGLLKIDQSEGEMDKLSESGMIEALNEEQEDHVK